MYDLVDNDMTMMVVSHEINFVSEVADSVAFMDQGMFLEEDSPSRLFSAPSEHRTQEFISQIL